jgi:hypothetical protein
LLEEREKKKPSRLRGLEMMQRKNAYITPRLALRAGQQQQTCALWRTNMAAR